MSLSNGASNFEVVHSGDLIPVNIDSTEVYLPIEGGNQALPIQLERGMVLTTNESLVYPLLQREIVIEAL